MIDSQRIIVIDDEPDNKTSIIFSACVITSYSIHYTKLYELPDDIAALFFRFADRDEAFAPVKGIEQRGTGSFLQALARQESVFQHF